MFQEAKQTYRNGMFSSLVEEAAAPLKLHSHGH